AAQGNLDAMNSIGYIYENGSGGEPPRLYIFDEKGKNIDPDLPFIEAKYAAYEFGLPVKTYPREIYPMSEYGQGVESDVSLAVSWYQKAAAQGHALAQTNLAYFYLMGIAVDKDEQQAFTLYQRAAEQDFAPALRSLAFMYMQGLGTKQDIPKAFAALEQAYRLQPDNNMWKTIRMTMKRRYGLKTTLTEYNEIFRNQFEYEDSSNEDHLIERFKFFNKIYQLDFSNANGLTALFVWTRPTVGILLGESVGENSIFKERYFIKRSIQGYYITMRFLSYYYMGEELDIERAQLWRKYAIQMGESPHESNWPDYPPLTE
ncbi:tetratricopeptide repeat protein, partial [Orbus sasakiae]|uniref:tetratricopeptide repeat protein n=1 Tax=Orbus sasakiae TaxID=1078475 RepID=UPI0031F03F74